MVAAGRGQFLVQRKKEQRPVKYRDRRDGDQAQAGHDDHIRGLNSRDAPEQKTEEIGVEGNAAVRTSKVHGRGNVAQIINKSNL